MQLKNTAILFATVAIFLNPTLGFGQIGPVSGTWRHGDSVNNRSFTLLMNGRIAMNETRFLPAEKLAKRCSTGVRVTSKGAFGEPVSIVILFDLWLNTNLKRVPAAGWREYWFADQSALTINRVTKFLELKDEKKLGQTITKSPLWTLKSQHEIEGFKFGTVDGYSVEVELFSGGRSKHLSYSNPDSYPEKENLQFRTALHNLLGDLGLSSDGFVDGLNELNLNPSDDSNDKENSSEPQR